MILSKQELFGMTLTRLPLTMQLTSGLDVFAHVWTSNNWQYSAIWQETFQFLSNVTRFSDCFFFKLPQIRTSNFCNVVRQHTKGTVGSIGFVGNVLLIYFTLCLPTEGWLRLSRPGCLVLRQGGLPVGPTCPKMVTHPGTNRTWRKVTTLIETIATHCH